MRPTAQYEAVRALLRDGLNHCEIARRTGIPRGTVRDWSHRDDAPGTTGAAGCPVCLERLETLDPIAYAYLLGLYLGDGCLSLCRRGVYRLRVSLDDRYPGIIRECGEAIRQVRPGATIGRSQRTGCSEVHSGWKHWPCLFPQHGPGRKHERKIELAPWQAEIVGRHPERLLRGLVHSDGCRCMNRVTVRGVRYAYPRYMFTNNSGDIRSIFCAACDAHGVRWTQTNWKTISVARRQDVARLDEVIGPKA